MPGTLSMRHRLRAVVVTADRYNPEHGLVAPLCERAAPDRVPAFLVPLTKQDWPTSAVIGLSRTRGLDPRAITGPAGQLKHQPLGNLALAARICFGVAD